MITSGLAKITGHVKISDPNSGEIFYNDHNAIHRRKAINLYHGRA